MTRPLGPASQERRHELSTWARPSPDSAEPFPNPHGGETRRPLPGQSRCVVRPRLYRKRPCKARRHTEAEPKIASFVNSPVLRPLAVEDLRPKMPGCCLDQEPRRRSLNTPFTPGRNESLHGQGSIPPLTCIYAPGACSILIRSRSDTSCAWSPRSCSRGGRAGENKCGAARHPWSLVGPESESGHKISQLGPHAKLLCRVKRL